jgi:hypothetical protein
MRDGVKQQQADKTSFDLIVNDQLGDLEHFAHQEDKRKKKEVHPQRNHHSSKNIAMDGFHRNTG